MREELILLTAAELDFENCRAAGFPQLQPVHVWIRYPPEQGAKRQRRGVSRCP
jgi:hypothetical protein